MLAGQDRRLHKGQGPACFDLLPGLGFLLLFCFRVCRLYTALGSIRFLGFIGFIGFTGFIGFIGFVGFIGFRVYRVFRP